MNMITIFFVSNSGAGFAGQLQVREGITVGELFAQQMPDSKPEHCLIRVTRGQQTIRAPEASFVLREGDRYSATPNKVAGARGRNNRSE